MIERVAFLSIHTCPLTVPGSGNAGGMNVYIDELAGALAARGVAVDVFTARRDANVPDEVESSGGYRVVHVDVASDDPAGAVGEFAEGVIKWAAAREVRHDVVHSHYWLSGWAGVLLQDVLDVPFAISFHTLGRVKDANRRADDPPTSLLRIAAETEVISRAGCVVASTPVEAGQLLEHYGADPERLCVSPPGVDHDVFHPGDRARSRAALGLSEGPMVLFAGRIQPLKAADVAVRAFVTAADRVPDLQMLVIGGPSGPRGEREIEKLRDLAAGHRIEFRPPMPHAAMADAFRAADVLLVPSRSESFGLVAAEAQACGLPVIASRVGGLAHAVSDGTSGFLVDGWDPAHFGEALVRVLGDPATAARLSAGAVAHAEQFSWVATVDRLLELYAGIMPSAAS
jgi:D-inositol-3-phosphate glycosyltransferase